jgi:hypothetical protein
MANLLSRPSKHSPFTKLDPERSSRAAERFRAIADWQRALENSGRRAEQGLAGFLEGVEASIDELEAGSSLPLLEDLLSKIDEARRSEWEALSSDGSRLDSAPPSEPGGAWLCYWPTRSLETGEANLASRGFFDALDRPPLALWLTAVARSRGPRGGDFELAVLAWVPPIDVDRARAGRAVCTSGSLAWLEETSEELVEQLGPWLQGRGTIRDVTIRG